MKNKATRLAIIIVAALAVLAAGGIAISTFMQGGNNRLSFSKNMIKETIVNQVCDVEEYVENPQGKALRMTAVYIDENGVSKPCLVVGLTFKPTQLGEVKITIESTDGEKIEATIEIIEAAPTIAGTEDGEVEWKTKISLQDLKQYVIYNSAVEPEFCVVSAEFRDQKFELRDEKEFTFEEIGIYIFTFELSTRGGMATGSIQVKSSRALTELEKNDLTNNCTLYPGSHATLSMSEEHAENSDWAWEIKAHPDDTITDPNGGYFQNQIRIDFGREIDLSQYYFSMDIKPSKDSGGVAIHYLTDENIWSAPMGFHEGLGEWNHISGMDKIKEGKYTALAVVVIHPQGGVDYDPENVTCLIDNLQLHQYPDPNAPIIVGGVEKYDITTSKVSWKADGSAGDYQMPYVEFNKDYTNQTMTFTTKIDTKNPLCLIIGARVQDAEISYAEGCTGLMVGFWDGFFEVYAPKFSKLLGAERLELENGKEYTFSYSVETADAKDTLYLKVTDASGNVLINHSMPLPKDVVNKTGSFVIWNPADKVTIEYEEPKMMVRKHSVNVVVPSNGKAGVAGLSAAMADNLSSAAYLAIDGDYTTETFSFTTKIKDKTKPNLIVGTHMNGIDPLPAACQGVSIQFYWDKTNSAGFYEVYAPQHQKLIGAERIMFEDGKEYTFHVSLKGQEFNLMVEFEGQIIHDRTFEVKVEVPAKGKFMVWTLNESQEISYEMPANKEKAQNKNVIVKNTDTAGTAELETIAPNSATSASFLALYGNYTNETFTFTTTIVDPTNPNLIIGARMAGVDALPSAYEGITIQFFDGFYEVLGPIHGKKLADETAAHCTFEAGKEYTFSVKVEDGIVTFAVVNEGNKIHEQNFVIPSDKVIPDNGSFMVWNMDSKRTINYEKPEVVVPGPTEVTVQAIDDRTTVVEGVHQLYLQTNLTAVTSTWSGWDNIATVTINGTTDVVANACWAADGLMYLQPSVPTGETLESMTIKAGTIFVISETEYEITDDYTLYYYDGGYHTIAKIPMTITGMNATSNVTDGVFQLYLQTNATNTEAWNTAHGWDHAAQVYVNGTTACTAQAIWSSTTGELFMQPALPEGVTVDSILIKAGTRFSLLGTIYEVTQDYTVYYYDGGLHDTPQVRETPITINAIDSRSTYGNGAYQVYLATNTTGVTATWSGWDNATLVKINGTTDCVANICWAADGLMYLQPSLPTGVTLESITISAGTQFVVSETLYTITDTYTVYYYDGGYHNTPKPEGTSIIINAIDSRSTYGNGAYQVYLATNTTGVTATWSGWDNATLVKINGTTDCVANICWAADGLLYLQPSLPSGVTLESITISAGTQFVVSEKIYAITDTYTVYYYDGGYHNTPRPEGTSITINAIDSRSTYGNGAYQVYLATNTTGVTATWSGWDNATLVKINGTTDCVANICWAADGLMYLQPSVPTGVTLESITISAGTQFVVSETLYTITDAYTVYYYGGEYHNTPKVEGTPITVNSIDSRSTVANGTYQVYLLTNATGVTVTWANWDNITKVTINGTTNVVANACWAADGLLYIQPALPSGMTLESMTIHPGTQFVINETVYEITDGYTVYYYNGGYHSTAQTALRSFPLAWMQVQQFAMEASEQKSK